MKRAFTSDMITFQQGSSIIFSAMTDGRGELHVISERDGYKRGQVELRIIRIDGEELESRVYPVIMNGRGSVGLGEIILSEYEQRRFDCIAVFTLTWDDGQRIENHYTLSRPKHMRLPQPRIELRQVSDTALAVSSDIFAKGVYLFHPDPKLVLDDNYFDLLPGKERLIKAAKALNAGEMQIFNYHH
jgi:beta-mannosidase